MWHKGKGAEYLSHHTQAKLGFQPGNTIPVNFPSRFRTLKGLARDWIKPVLQAGIALSEIDDIQENLIACLRATTGLTGTDLGKKSGTRG